MNKILAICLVVTSLFAVAIFIFKVPTNTVLTYGAILLCPLMHFFMMGHGDSSKEKSEDSKKCH